MFTYSMQVRAIGYIDKRIHEGVRASGLGSHASMYGSGLFSRNPGALPIIKCAVSRGTLQNVRTHKTETLRKRSASLPVHSLYTSACVRSQSRMVGTQPLPPTNAFKQTRNHLRRDRVLPPQHRDQYDQDTMWPGELFPTVFLRPTLSEEQNRVLKKVVEDKESVFFTGSAGTGKSVLLRAIIDALGGPSDEVVVTASTGIAAVNIGGQTLHSFAGVGLGNASINRLVRRAKWTSEAKWRKVKTLIIDEVSMVDATWFDCLEEIARRVRRKNEPFGGIQLVICGDFFQLPPVPNREFANAPASFVFDAWTWDRCIKTKVMLTQVFRQKDPKLVKLLNDARIGVVSEESARLLRGLARPVDYEDGIGPTEIYPLRSQADRANRRMLDALPGETFAYDAEDCLGKDQDGNRIQPERAADLFRQMVVPEHLRLKVGAQVMCLRNVQDVGVVNGSTGRVVGFTLRRDFKRAVKHPQRVIISNLEPKPKKKKAKSISQQAQTLEPIPRDDDQEDRMDRMDRMYRSIKWPVVEFPGGMQAMMGPVLFTVENKESKVEVKRLQVPLMLSWALTVHKSQGQTLDRVKIDLERTFERGQAYVALSRCTSLEGLEVYNFSKASVVAHPRVQQWSRQLITLNPHRDKINDLQKRNPSLLARAY